MMLARALQVLVLAFLASASLGTAEKNSHLMIDPQSPVLEIGTNFTATCIITNEAELSSDELYWNLSKTTVPKEQYTKINRSALSVTFQVTGEKLEWLFCLCKKMSPYVVLNSGKFIHGILLVKGYQPVKPENLSCIAVQENTYISPTISCSWEPVGRQTIAVPLTYTLNVHVSYSQLYRVQVPETSAQVTLEVFPNHMTLDIWVEAENMLGKVESSHLTKDAGWFVKTNPPSDVIVFSEESFPAALLINWKHPISEESVSLRYEIRYCSNGSQNWTYVPLVDTAKYIQSFRLQKLVPDTVYITQVRCKNAKEDHGYWSDWSSNTTKRTPESPPRSKPDLWMSIIKSDGKNERLVVFICKEPVLSNGRIKRFDIMTQDQKDKVKNGSVQWESVLVNSTSGQRQITVLKQIDLAEQKNVTLYVTAINSAGKSTVASLTIPQKRNERAPVEGLNVWPHGGQLWLEWKSPNSKAVSEYVVQWATGDQTDWQKESQHTTHTFIKGNLEKFVCYNVSVYPIYSGVLGKPASIEAFLEQGAPLEGPDVGLNGRPGRNDAAVIWNQIPLSRRRGFITNYTIFYTDGITSHAVTVPADTTSYTLTSLSGNTKYDTWIRASTIRGSASGSNHSFTTLKYATGEIEGIVVGVSFGFLFIVIMTMLLCVYKKDVIKQNFWPQIPNPRESTIGNWSPGYPLKAETPNENCLSGISVLDVDLCDGKSVFDEDKASLPLKKDKYLSEEHSSGIGGSSCMSSPRQSVSDSDEGGDIADTTASTVQYSSVVASNGYKGQTPSSQPQQAIFSRSESTQPLLDSEENPDMLLLDGSRPSQRLAQQPCVTHDAWSEEATNSAECNHLEMEQQEVEPLDFCPLDEDSKQTTPTDIQSADWSATPASSCMPQLGGYRPQ